MLKCYHSLYPNVFFNYSLVTLPSRKPCYLCYLRYLCYSILLVHYIFRLCKHLTQASRVSRLLRHEGHQLSLYLLYLIQDHYNYFLCYVFNAKQFRYPFHRHDYAPLNPFIIAVSYSKMYFGLLANNC